MKLEPISRLHLAYDAHGAVSARPFGTDEGIGFGTGTGHASDGLEATVRWSNHPRRASDGTLRPDLRGVLSTVEGAQIFFHFEGRIDWATNDDQRLGLELLSGGFATEDERFSWINTAFCVAEGVIDPATLQLELVVWRVVHDGATFDRST